MVSAEQLGEQAAVTQWPLRILLVLLTLAVIVAALYGLRRGWVNRGARQGVALLAVPPSVAATVEHGEGVSGSYIGTTVRGRPLERMVAAGTRAQAEVVVGDFGVAVIKQGDPTLYIAAATITSVGTAAGMLQRHFGGHGLLKIDWEWDDHPVTTGLWFVDAADQADVRQRILGVHREGVS